ncbi:MULTISPECIES: hypothetical protein [unclassified Olivibacter]|jgi:hypothetical protein|uniref:Zinc-finger domain-containing protein n=1 Tax=Sphingobacterium sp. (strain 21) TaxID=743722 RepID=F4C2N2_SPHS2|nr:MULTISPECIES: hypothetical protein [unclassified Olivibacter]MDM8172834.1 hypothetical protein [Olivibacter sp. 47]QEL02704.1 hypothetical protein FKG96_18390 [Olivibacter sp. LS-1]
MKELSEAELKKIAYNCRKATFLIEKQQIGKITLREKMELKIHLTGCSICVTFMQQSAVINQMARKLFTSDYKELKLDEGFKEQLQKRINNQLDEN